MDAGFAIGEAVAKEILAARAADGAEKPNPPLEKVPGKWWVEAPMETGAGRSPSRSRRYSASWNEVLW